MCLLASCIGCLLFKFVAIVLLVNKDIETNITNKKYDAASYNGEKKLQAKKYHNFCELLGLSIMLSCFEL
jgi:hypothetical protein